MDMNKILQNLDSAAEGEYTPSKQESSDMKMILESFYDVAQQDAVESKPQQLDEIASVSMSGETADEVAQLVRLMNNAGAPEAAPVGPQPTTMPAPVDMPADGPPDMPPKADMITPKMMDNFESDDTKVKEGNNKYPHIFDFQDLYGIEDKEQYIDMADDASYMEIDEFEDTYSNVIDMARDFWEDHRGQSEVIEDDYANEPDERYDDHETMTHDLSGGLNKRKNSYADAEDGDNPMAVESSLAEELSSMLKKKMSEKKDQDGDGDNDFDDVKIARMKASGMSHDEAVAKVKGKKEGSKKNADTEVKEDDDEDDDPCWKGYKMVGTKKKGGKEVPNCVPEGVEEAAPKNNPVAKNAGKFNKAKVEPNKKKERDKGKNVKHKGKEMQMESAPVFDRYVKPIINKTPKQMVEFYDREARTIINRLSRERRSLAETNGNTKMHDVVIGRLRENLDVVSEAPYGGRFRGRDSWDSNMPGYDPGGELGSRDSRFNEPDFRANDEYPDYNLTRQHRGPFYLRIDGKTYKQKGQPKEFSNKKGAEGYGRAMMRNNRDLVGRITIAGTPEDRK